MSKKAHYIYLALLIAIGVISFAYLSYTGISYYRLPLEERFYHPMHESLKPSGILGHGLGIIGSLLILIGVFSYMARKRYRSLARLGLLKHWLEFHIFLCSEGAILILFHTAFKFGGLVSVSFWSMVAVVLSGIIGRFIYIQIPRTIEGRELNLAEVIGLKSDMTGLLKDRYRLSDSQITDILNLMQTDDSGKNSKSGVFSFLSSYWDSIRIRSKFQKILKVYQLDSQQRKQLSTLFRNEIRLNRRIRWLHSMQTLFKYWHVAHLPFALVMLLIMIIHVGVTLLFGYKWIF